MQPSIIALNRSPSHLGQPAVIVRLRRAIAAAFKKSKEAEIRAFNRQQVYLGL